MSVFVRKTHEKELMKLKIVLESLLNSSIGVMRNLGTK